MSDETLDHLAQSFVKRWRNGERPRIEEYAERHPQLADDIRTIFPALIALEKGAPAEIRENPPPGDLGEFRIIREIARGGMGVVYEAEQTTLARRVALKVLPSHACRDPRLLDRFRREAQAAARLHHTNIVPVYGLGEHAGIHFYTMQFVHGQSMNQVIAELRRIRHGDSLSTDGVIAGLSRPDSDRPFFKSVARLGMHVADALAYAHAQGVIHRDIKPSNLMLDAEGTVWVTDFGLARSEGADNLTRTGDIVGTLRYMAPERFHGWSDPRSDIYSLGLTLYEMLALRPAYCETDVNRLIRRITESDLPPLHRRRRNIPRDLETVVLRATARDPADRYQTAAEMARDLGRFLADRPVRAQRASPLRRLRAWCRRNPLAAGLSALVLFLLVTVLFVSGVALVMLRAERDAAVGNLDRAEAAEARLLEELRSSHVAQARALRASRRPGQRFEALEQLARAARIRPSPELRDDVIATLAQLDVRTLRHWTGESGCKPQALDPLRRRFAHAEKDGDITLHRIPDGEEMLRLPGAGGASTVASFSPDGRFLGTLYKTGPKTAFRVWDLDRAAVVAEEPSCGQRGSVHFDGKGRAAVGAPDGGILIIDLERSSARTLPGAGRSPAVRLRFSPDGHVLAAADGGNDVRLLDPERGELKTLGFPEMVFDFAWHPRTDWLAVATGNEVRIWDVAGSRLVRVMHGHHGIVADVEFSASGSLIASSGWDRRTVLWDAATGEQHLVLPRASSFADPYLYGTAGPNEAWLDEVVPSPCVGTIDEHTMWTGPSAVVFSPDRRIMATVSTDRIRIWDLAHLRESAALPLSHVILVAFPSAATLVAATPERIVSWPVVTDAGQGVVAIGPPEVLHEEAVPDPEEPFPTERDLRFMAALRGAIGPVPMALLERVGRPYIALSADGRWAATRVWQARDFHVWDLQRGERVRSFAIQNALATFTPDGKHLVVNGLYEPCKIFETGSWSLVREFESAPSGIAVSADGTVLAAAALPSGVALFALPGFTTLASLQTEGALMPAVLRFNAEGDRLAVVQSHRVQLWDLGLVREELVRLGLAEGLPAWPATGSARAAGPLRAEVSLGSLAPADVRVPVRGRVVVVDSGGAEYPAESGSFRLIQSGPDGTGFGSTVRVVHGAWEADIREGARLSFDSLSLGDRVAILDDRAPPHPETGTFALRARWPDPAALRVLDESGTTELEEVEILRCSGEHEDEIHPAGDTDAERIVKGVASPVLLPAGERTRVYWVRAQGYAWRRVAIDHGSGGEREVRLEPGGALEITFANAGPAGNAHLYIYSPPDDSGQPALDVEPKPPARTVIEGLAPGEYAVEYTIGRWFQRPIRLARETVRVEPGGRAKLALTLVAQPPEKKRVPLAGMIEIPAAWGRMLPQLRVESLERGAEFDAWIPEDRIREEKPGVYRWDAGAVPVGRHIAHIAPFEMQVLLSVPDAGDREARIVIPEPADLVVRVLDRSTNEPADLLDLMWNAARPSRSTGGSLSRAQRDPASKTFSLRVPAGKIEFGTMGGPWTGLRETREVPPGKSEITILADAACGIEVSLKEGEATVPFDRPLRVSAERPDGEDASYGTMYNPPHRTLWLKDPGPCRIVFSGALDGYESPQPRDAIAERGKTVKVLVMLKRKA